MAHDSVDSIRGFPQFSGTGAPADAADLSEIAAWAGANIDRAPLAAISNLGSQSPLFAGRTEHVTAVPGVKFVYNGSGWDMVGVAKFTTAALRDSGITAPVAGMECVVTADGTADNNGRYVYLSGAWQYVTPKVVVTAVTSGAVANGATIATIVLAAVAHATTVDVEMDATLGNATGGAAAIGADMAVSAGTLTKYYAAGNNPTVSAGLRAGFARSGSIAIPANTAVTITITMITVAATGIFEGRVKTTRR